jgi:hypothetical protein
MAVPVVPPTLNLGFLTVFHESSGYVGGYLVTNNWGRPLEFRLSTAVQPNRVHQVLYGPSLVPYVCGDLIARTLVEKTATQAQLLLTDTEAVLDLRLKVATPVVWLAPADHKLAGDANLVRPAGSGCGPILCHPRLPDDGGLVRDLLAQAEGMDLVEPFVRIREAMSEARKMGVTNRAAA